MSHHVAHICIEHNVVQRQCRCPQPITSVIVEECKHGELTGDELYWQGTKIVRGSEMTTQAKPKTVTILWSDLHWLLTEYHQPKDVTDRCWAALREAP